MSPLEKVFVMILPFFLQNKCYFFLNIRIVTDTKSYNGDILGQNASGSKSSLEKWYFFQLALYYFSYYYKHCTVIVH